MREDLINNDSAYIQDKELYDIKTTPVPKPPIDIGIEYKGELYQNIMDAEKASIIDASLIQSFSSISQSRDTIYSLLDTMAEDPTISAVLEIYAEDATETSENGRIIWCQSDDANVNKFITFLLDSLNIDKNIYQWVFSLIKYGDTYIRLYRKSEVEGTKDINIKKPLNEDLNSDTEQLNEDIKVIAFAKDDKYSHYVEMVPNPAEMFELTRYGKSYAYIQAPSATTAAKVDNMINQWYKYQFNQKDVNIYDATCFVHGCLSDNSTRTPEEVELFREDTTSGSPSMSFKVKRGQSILYNSFKIWREMMLLENSLLLNRLTKSSIARIIGVEIGDMPKEMVAKKMMDVKQLFEQKTALNSENSMAEYTNPGPMENNVYVPTHEGKGNITVQQVGGDVDVKGLADVDYFTNKLYGSLRVPKQYLGDTDDSTGFNGGTSLSIISSRYAKAIKRVQSTVVQMITDMINLILIDRGLQSYINKFELHMVPPTTQEEIDKRENTSQKVQLVGDVMNLLSDIEDQSKKFRVLKSLLSDVISDEELILVLQECIDELEEQEEQGEDTTDGSSDVDYDSIGGGGDDFNFDMDFGGGGESDFDLDTTSTETSEEETLPSPSDLGAGDFTDANMEI